MRAQAEMGVGGLISLLILIAIGAMVLYSVTSALGITTAPSTTLTMTADNAASSSDTLGITESISSATLTIALNTDNALDDGGSTILIVQLNDENMVVATNDNISAENTVTDYVVEGTNTVTVTNDNDNVFWDGSVVLDISTYAGSAIGNVESKGSTILNLMTILAIVVVAALIIGVVMRAIGGAGGRSGTPAF